MAPFVMAAIPSLIQAAPALIRLFGSGEQSEKNAAAAEAVAHIAKQITNEATVEGAVNVIQADPDVSKQFSDAVESNWFALTGEAGGGGIAGARAANANAPRWQKNQAILVTVLVLPLIYMVVGAVLFSDFSNDIKIMVISTVMTAGFGGVMAYFFGTSAGSASKTDMLAKK